MVVIDDEYCVTLIDDGNFILYVYLYILGRSRISIIIIVLNYIIYLG